ncbi:MAG: DUF3450 family protein [Verrucomicrobiota bacterium]
MGIRFIAITCLVGAISVAPLNAQTDVSDTKAKLAKWVETRQLISKEASNWQVEKEFLISTETLLQEQAATLTEQLDKLQEEGTVADEERRELLVRRAELQRTMTALEERVAVMEAEVLRLVKLFPEPLQRKVDRLVVGIPEDPASTKLPISSRITQVLGVLIQAEKFNSTTTSSGEIREVGDQKIQVDTLYWGLSYAVYVDPKGEIAGFGVPGPDGWDWVEDNDAAPQVRKFMDINQGNTEVIEFVELPFTVK